MTYTLPSVHLEFWKKHMIELNLTVPICKYYYSDGTIFEGQWIHDPYFNDETKKLHRENGPAIEWSDGSGGEWYSNGRLHNFEGPAIKRDCRKDLWRYFVEGKEIRADLFYRIHLKDKESLVEYLLSSDSAIRVLAEYRLKQLDWESGNENRTTNI